MDDQNLIKTFSVEELEQRFEMKAWIRVKICTSVCPDPSGGTL